METVKHTPYKVVEVPAAVFSIYDSENNKVASIESPKTAHFGIGRKRAESIVTACNSYADLLAALDKISCHAYDDDTPVKDMLADFDNMRMIALKAIAKAEGK